MKNILAENMRRFGTKNLTEAAMVSKTAASSVPQSLVGRTVTMWTKESQTGDGMDLGIVRVQREGKNRVTVSGLDLSDAELIDAYNAGRSVTVTIEFMLDRGDTKFFDTLTGMILYNRWLVGELTKTYFK